MFFFTPVSMAQLNTQINDYLTLNNSWGVIRKSANDGIIQLVGGLGPGYPGSGAYIRLTGCDSVLAPLGISFAGPNAAKNANVDALWIGGPIDNPTIDCINHRVERVAAPQIANDALRLNAWAAWNPTLTWGVADPAGISKVARWTQIGNIVYWMLMISSADSNATNSLIATLPKACIANATYPGISAIQLNNATWLDPLGYLDTDNSLLKFRAFATGVDGTNIRIDAEGWYEAGVP